MQTMSTMDHRAVLLAPDHVPGEFGGSYETACLALDLEPLPGGYALYLMDVMNIRATVISTDTGPVRQAKDNVESGGDGYLMSSRLATGNIIDIRGGWPEELGGGPRCQFCRNPHPAWIYEGPAVEVLIGERLIDFGPPPVVGSDVVGCIDWPACGTCHDLIETADFDSWRGLLDRYGDPDVPMPVQAAWREFWTNHRPPAPAPPPPWTPHRRRRTADSIAAHWDDFTAEQPVDDVVFTSDPRVPGLAGVDAALEAARGYLLRPPLPGAVRSYPHGEAARIVRADGDGWSLVGRTDSISFILLDTAPNLTHLIGRGPTLPALMAGLDRIAQAEPNDVVRDRTCRA